MTLKRNLDIIGSPNVVKKKPVIEDTNATELFEATFKIGDWVVLITDEDRVVQGKLLEHDANGCILRQFMSTKRVHWGEIVLICHDGFPIKKLRPSGADEFIEQLLKTREARSLQEIVRRALVNGTCLDCNRLAENNHLYYGGRCEMCKMRHDRSSSYGRRRNRSFSIGDPFEIVNVHVNVVNPGNISKFFEEQDDTFIETILMEAKDGARGHLYTLNSMIGFE